MTPEQQKDSERLDRYIVREGLASVMNDTKWREAIQVLQDVMGYRVQFRLKDVRGSEPAPSYWDRDFPHHVGRYKAIEWLEINTVVEIYKDRLEGGRYNTGKTYDYSEEVAEALNAKSIPFYQTDGVIRLQGYTRSSKLSE